MSVYAHVHKHGAVIYTPRMPMCNFLWLKQSTCASEINTVTFHHHYFFEVGLVCPDFTKYRGRKKGCKEQPFTYNLELKWHMKSAVYKSCQIQWWNSLSGTLSNNGIMFLKQCLHLVSLHIWELQQLKDLSFLKKSLFVMLHSEEFPLTEKQTYGDNAYLCTLNISSLCRVKRDCI